MIKFKRFTLKNLHTIKKYATASPLRCCDFSLGVMIMWDSSFSYEYAIISETLVLKTYYGEEEWFFPPIGKNVNSAIKEIEKYCEEEAKKEMNDKPDIGEVIEEFKRKNKNLKH